MSLEYRAPDWDTLRMDYADPHRSLEPPEREIDIVDQALECLCDAGVLPSAKYDLETFAAHRSAVAVTFEIPWTAISPRVQRLLYAISAITRPLNMIAAGVFCGNTFISNAGAAVGPGAVYSAQDLVGVEIRPEEAERAERNVRRIDPTGIARVIAADAVDVAASYPGQIDLLYLDADGAGGRGKGVYLDILEAALDKLHPGSVVIAHNSVNSADRLRHYLEFVRNPANMRASVNVILDDQGVEVCAR